MAIITTPCNWVDTVHVGRRYELYGELRQKIRKIQRKIGDFVPQNTSRSAAQALTLAERFRDIDMRMSIYQVRS